MVHFFRVVVFLTINFCCCLFVLELMCSLADHLGMLTLCPNKATSIFHLNLMAFQMTRKNLYMMNRWNGRRSSHFFRLNHRFELCQCKSMSHLMKSKRQNCRLLHGFDLALEIQYKKKTP